MTSRTWMRGLVIVAAIVLLGVLPSGTGGTGRRPALPGHETEPGVGPRSVEAAPLAVTVSGTIRHEGSPVGNVEVQLVTATGEVSAVTGVDGIYTLTGVPASDWANLHVTPQTLDRLAYQNHALGPISADLVKDIDLLDGYRLQGTIVTPEGVPYTEPRWLELNPVTFDVPAGQWLGTSLEQGAFDVVLPPGMYSLDLEHRPMPYFLPTTAPDLRTGDRLNVEIMLTWEIPQPHPIEPPDAAQISVGAPDLRGYATVTGAAGAVSGKSSVIVANLNARNYITTTAAPNGSFAVDLYAPPGSTLLVKVEPPGGHRIQTFWRNSQVNAAAETVSNLNALPGTTVRVGGMEPGTETLQSFNSVGGFFSEFPRGWGGWWLNGELEVPPDGGAPGLHVMPGDTITLTGVLRVTAPAIQCSGTPTPSVMLGGIGLFPRFDVDGRPLQSRTWFNAQLFTPTGLPIEHEAPLEWAQTASAIPLSNATCLDAHTFEGDVQVTMHLPPELREGVYRPVMFVYGDVPLSSDVPVAVVWYSSAEEVVDLPMLTVGEPAPPRIPWMLFSNVPVNGHRGVVANEDEADFGMTTRVRFPPHKAILPMRDDRTGQPIVYRMEPDSNWLSGTERRLPPVPEIPLLFPSGELSVEIVKPDGTAVILDPAPIDQSLIRTPTVPGGTDIAEGTGHIGDIFQLYNGDAFGYAFDQYGDHRIILYGEVEDVYGNVYHIHKTYDVTVARVLDLDPAQLPTTPYVVGDAFAPGSHVFPPVPADVTVSLIHMPASDPAEAVEHVVTGTANRFGVFQPDAGTEITLDEPGEFRVDLTAVYPAADGTLWAGAMTWGNVVASPSPLIRAHGRRGMDYRSDTIDGMSAWFITKNLPPDKVGIEVYYPYFSGDVHWGGQGDGVVGDSIHTILTIEDLTGPSEEIYNVLREAFPFARNCFRWPPEGCTDAGLEKRIDIGEAPLFIMASGGRDPAVVPEAIELWGYWYGSSERPDVHVREILSEDGMGTAYWRFNDTYGYQIGEPADGDHDGDMKWEFGGTVLRTTGPAPLTEYDVYSSFWVLLPEDDEDGTRITPPFRGADGTSIDGGPLLTLKGEDIDMLFLPKGVRPGDVLEVGDPIAFSGHVGPPLNSRVDITITAPSTSVLTATLRANKIGWVYDPSLHLPAEEPGRWTVDVHVEHDQPLAYAGVPSGYNTGTVLGTSGQYEFYVVEPEAPKLFITAPDPGFVQWTSDGVAPIHIRGVAPAGSTTVHYTVHDKGIVMDQGTVIPSANGAFTVTYDAKALHQDFPMLSLVAREGRWEGLADEVAINMLAVGGEPRANTVTLIGEEVFVGNDVRNVYLPLVLRNAG